MVSNLIKLGLGSLLVLSCQPAARYKNSGGKKIADSCRYYRYDVGQIISNLGCKNCHRTLNVEKFDERGIITFKGLATIDSLKLIDYAFSKKHKGWYSKTGTFRASRMDTLSSCEIKNIIRYIKDIGRDIPIPD